MSVFLLYFYLQKRHANTNLKQAIIDLRKVEKDLEINNEELKRYITSNTQLEQFAHVASHDLKTPSLQSTVFLDSCTRKQVTNSMINERKYLDFIQKNGLQMQELVNDLLDYSRINAQKLTLSEFRIQDLIQEVTDNLALTANEKGVQFEIEANLPYVICDKIKLKRVFQNLISNAIKFSDPQKAPWIKIHQ